MRDDPIAFVKLFKGDQITFQEAVETYLNAGDFFGKEYVFFEIVKKLVNYKNKAIALNFLVKLMTDEEIAVDMYRNKFTEVMFPIVGNSNGKIVRALVFETTKTYVNIPELYEEIKDIEKIVNKTLGVIFDDEFSGKSYMLAVTIGALVNKLPDNIAFSGEVIENGKVKSNVSHIELKQKICEESGIKLISALDINDVYELKDFFEAKKYHVPVLLVFKELDQDYIEASYERLKEAVARKYPLKYVNIFEKIFDIKKIYVSKSIKKDEWENSLKKAKEVLFDIISKRGVPHVAMIGPVAMAMALGIALGPHNPVVFYHGQTEYYPVLDLTDNIRKIKTIRNDYKQINYSIKGSGKNCAFVIYLASHSPRKDAELFIEKNKLNAKMVFIEYQHGKGNIKIDDWSDIVSEMMSVTQNVKSKYECARNYFFMSCPLPIAFGFGMAYGDFSKGIIYQYDKNEGGYIEAFKIEDIRG
ncbi:SAVED domain-containing protein [Thermosipho ferrireducens]|uniref:SAVED domain-containing protein n=2 Tax=Thermosipho ferrireducens TaxID=2571116 RepID=A0ABX7SBI6_9BACT|nr:SAVED domain-containing protein [Thermosipho ferrireducens]